MAKKLHRAINVASVTKTMVTVKCDRCKKTATGEVKYTNIEMFVGRELKYIQINTSRSTKSMYPLHKLVCLDCAKELEDFFLGESDADEK